MELTRCNDAALCSAEAVSGESNETLSAKVTCTTLAGARLARPPPVRPAEFSVIVLLTR